MCFAVQAPDKKDPIIKPDFNIFDPSFKTQNFAHSLIMDFISVVFPSWSGTLIAGGE